MNRYEWLGHRNLDIDNNDKLVLIKKAYYDLIL